MTFSPRYTTPLLLVLVLLAAGCNAGRLTYSNPQEAYEKGMDYYERGKYDRAIEYFQGVFDFGRTHEWADDAQLFLARSYRANGDLILAASEYGRFIQIYRGDLRLPEAEYERAMTYYERSPGYQLDQTPTRRAIEEFNLFISRHPGHLLRPEAEERVRTLREKLARKQYETARLYERRELYRAAAASFESAFDQYPDTPWADDALVGAMRTYIDYADESIASRQAERYQRAVEHYERLIQLFPNSPLLKDAEALYEQASARLRTLAANTP